MATAEDEAAARSELQEHLDSIAAMTPEALARDSLGEELNFREAVPNFERTLDLWRQVREIDLEHLPHFLLHPARSHAKACLGRLNEVMEFSLEKHGANAVGHREKLIQQVQDTYDQQFQAVLPLMTYNGLVRSGLDDARQAFEKLTKEMRDGLEAQEKEAQQLLDETKQARDAAQSASREAGLGRHAEVFKEEAEAHQKYGRIWLGVAGFLLIAAAGFAWWSYLALVGLAENGIEHPVEVTVARGLVFVVLLSGAFWTGHVYRTHRHNAVLNQHRHNALVTFETFVGATDDSGMKDAILLRATETIFSHQPTGYSSPAPSPGVAGLVPFAKPPKADE